MIRPSPLSLALLVAAPLALTGCGDDEDPEGAADLWARIHEADYQGWQRAPGYEARRDTAAPHGEQVDIFLNTTIAAAVFTGGPITSWPVGSIIVKDGYEGGELTQVAAMEKLEATWFWAEWDADGSSKYSGRAEDVATCTDCHQSGADLVRAFGFPQ